MKQSRYSHSAHPHGFLLTLCTSILIGLGESEGHCVPVGRSQIDLIDELHEFTSSSNVIIRSILHPARNNR